MRIGVISDSHGDVPATTGAIRVLDSLGVSITLHCGDVGVEVVEVLSGRRTHFVPGNTDDPERLRRAIVDPEHTFHNPLGELEVEGCRIAFLHGDNRRLLDETIASGHYDLVCRGHTHAFASSRQGRTLSLNPGALSRTQRPSLAVVEIPSLAVTHVPL
jgi:putative phosphoesterase